MTLDVEGVRDALHSGADPDLRIRSAALQRQPGTFLDFVRLLLHRSLRPSVNNAKTALMYASAGDDPEIVSELLQYHAKVNLRLDNGYSALLYAAPKRSPEILAALLAQGADVHAHLQDGTTPLLLAAQGGQTQNVSLLLAKREDIHESDQRSQTALFLATANRHEETIKLLLSQGADEHDLRAAHSSQMVPAMRFTTSGPNRSVITINGVTTILQGSQTIRLNPQPVPAGTMPPLLFAAKYGSPALLEFLWKRAAPDPKQPLAWEVLCSAVASGQKDAVRFLLQQNLPVNRPESIRPPGLSRNGYDPDHVYTPLHYAAALESPEITALLLARGANVNAEDTFRNDALARCRSRCPHRDHASTDRTRRERAGGRTILRSKCAHAQWIQQRGRPLADRSRSGCERPRPAGTHRSDAVLLRSGRYPAGRKRRRRACAGRSGQYGAADSDPVLSNRLCEAAAGTRRRCQYHQ